MRKKHTDNTAVADNEPSKFLPKVIMYDKVSGAPIHAQDVRAAPGREVNLATVPWKGWLREHAAQRLCGKATHIAAIRLVLTRSVPVAAWMWPQSTTASA